MCWILDSLEVKCPAEMVFWALQVVLPSGVGTLESRGGRYCRANGTWNPLCVSLALGRLEMVVNSDHNMPSDGGGLKQRGRQLAMGTRSRVEYIACLGRKCVRSKPHVSMGDECLK